MAYTKEQVIADIEAHIRNEGGTIGTWYVGIATDARKRLFNDHNVSEAGGSWIYRQATSSDTARTVETYFHNKGAKGGPGGGDSGTDYVYAYKITSNTKE